MPPGTDEDSFASRVLEIIDEIPPGRVLSYGDVAAMLGSRGARAVGTVLRTQGHGHPWWRVVRAGGLAPRGKEARALTHYEVEGTPRSEIPEPPGYRVQYAVARWNPLRETADFTSTTTTDPENHTWHDA